LRSWQTVGTIFEMMSKMTGYRWVATITKVPGILQTNNPYSTGLTCFRVYVLQAGEQRVGFTLNQFIHFKHLTGIFKYGKGNI
jgi:hypothetical protein